MAHLANGYSGLKTSTAMSQSFKPGNPYWWQWLTVLSLDAPLVALAWQTLFARILKVELPWQQPVLLGLAVWVIYAADRWIEGWRLSPETVLTQRHHFYILWRWPVFMIGLAVILVGLGLAVVWLPGREWAASTVLAIPTAVYLLSHQFFHREHPGRIPKELCIAALFPLGTALAPIVFALPTILHGQSLVEIIVGRLEALWIPLGLFGLLCLANLVLISAWETEVDAQHGQTSLALQFSHRLGLIRSLPWLLACLGAAVSVGMHGIDRVAGICATVSAILLGVLDYVEPRIGRQAARIFVDLTLLSPAVALLLL
ncbi:MAG TPA: hypothetical protein VL357_02650 [Rariglobus sp.]|nr:hypothetical protein [Rariglobus sp.]